MFDYLVNFWTRGLVSKKKETLIDRFCGGSSCLGPVFRDLCVLTCAKSLFPFLWAGVAFPDDFIDSAVWGFVDDSVVFAIVIISFRVLIYVSYMVVLGGVATFPGIVEGHLLLLERFWKTLEMTSNVLGICSSLLLYRWRSFESSAPCLNAYVDFG